jgi:hypothetical protein
VTEAQIAAEAEVLLAVLRTDQEAGRHDRVVRLARACAPSFALAMRWGAWERALRFGLESARATESVALEAWFHHELGVLTFCAGAYDRSRAELEASVALRGALADARGTATGRHVLELLDQAVVLGGAAALGAARGREERLRRFAPFAARWTPSRSAAGSTPRLRPTGRHALDLRAQPASRRQLALAAGGVVLMGVLGAGVAIAVTSLGGDTHHPTSGTPVVPAATATPDPGFPPMPDTPTDSASPSSSASHSATASPSASATPSSGTGGQTGQPNPGQSSTPPQTPSTQPSQPGTPTTSPTTPKPPTTSPGTPPPSGSASSTPSASASSNGPTSAEPSG